MIDFLKKEKLSKCDGYTVHSSLSLSFASQVRSIEIGFVQEVKECLTK